MREKEEQATRDREKQGGCKDAQQERNTEGAHEEGEGKESEHQTHPALQTSSDFLLQPPGPLETLRNLLGYKAAPRDETCSRVRDPRVGDAEQNN